MTQKKVVYRYRITRYRNLYARICQKISDVFQEEAYKHRCCADCGRSTFYGQPCIREGGVPPGTRTRQIRFLGIKMWE